MLQELSDTSHLRSLLKHPTTISIDELSRCLRDESCNADDILDYLWPTRLSQVTFRSTTSVLQKEELKNELKKVREVDDVLLKRNLKVKVLDIAWMFKDKQNFLQLAKILEGCPNSVYESLFIKKIFDEFWTKWQRIIIVK